MQFSRMVQQNTSKLNSKLALSSFPGQGLTRPDCQYWNIQRIKISKLSLRGVVKKGVGEGKNAGRGRKRELKEDMRRSVGEGRKVVAGRKEKSGMRKDRREGKRGRKEEE